MREQVSDADAARGARTIEWLKAELVSGSAAVFRAMVKNSEDAVIEALANIVVAAYILGRRLGIPFSRLEMKVESKVKANIEENHAIEQWYGDFTALLRHLHGRR